MYCRKCGAHVNYGDAFCPKCGYSLPSQETGTANNQTYTQAQNTAPLYDNDQPQEEFSEKNGLVALLLAIFLGYLGIHSFYTGRIGIGIAQLLTAGGCGIWVIVDIILLVTGSLRDGNGKLIKLD